MVTDAEKYRWLIDNLGYWQVSDNAAWVRQDGSRFNTCTFYAYGRGYLGYTFEEGLEMAIADRKEKA